MGTNVRLSQSSDIRQYQEGHSGLLGTVSTFQVIIYSRGGRLLKAYFLIMQEVQLSSSCPTKTSRQTDKNTLIG